MNYHVRLAEETDIGAVQRIVCQSWHDTYEGIIPRSIQDAFLNKSYSNQTMLQRIELSSLYVVESDKRIEGFANFSRVSEKGISTLYAIYLYPDTQGNGMGTALLEYGIEDLKPAFIQLNVEKENAKGMAFYKGRGFKIISEFTEDLSGHTLHTCTMELEVNRSSN
ncbi:MULTISPECIES: GNAT family N-acetyltransferase [Oceanobacillus]|uniref:GNAT family N-acetyltransferase n=1 Tax=Oceanobacillus TaxID=182709 RepID=UPI002116E63F|nr:GNAT family N-acetyltransferase [Oceanobacillus oncorhynchi]UUI41920.1 GNAT family N-acetyltransferase [Oceanobacillus oncorhynchi]